jgi:hypothetical protein
MVAISRVRNNKMYLLMGRQQGGHRTKVKLTLKMSVGALSPTSMWIQALWKGHPLPFPQNPEQFWMLRERQDGRWGGSLGFLHLSHISLHLLPEQEELSWMPRSKLLQES